MIPPSFINIPIELIYFMARVPPARLPGRPQSGTGDQEFPFRERLLDAARDLFATRGYAATSMRQVALGAGVTPALAHYYFKDKAGLSEAVLRERIAPLVNGIEAALEAHGADAVTALAGFVQQFTQVSSRHPWLPQLLLRELADAVGPATPVMRPLAERLHSLVAAVAVRVSLPGGQNAVQGTGYFNRRQRGNRHDPASPGGAAERAQAACARRVNRFPQSPRQDPSS
jgi:AcrR family transcriptional regulator